MRLFRRAKEDKGAANTVSFILIMFFVMIMLISIIDVGLYFNVKNDMQAAAENGARNSAIYGGTGGNLRSDRGATQVAAATIVWNSINHNSETTNTKVKMVEVSQDKISCGPNTTLAGEPVYCEITYKYNGLAGAFGMFRLGGKNVKVKGVAVSEVQTR